MRAVATTLLAFLLFTVSTEVFSNALWDEAVKHFEETSSLVPGRMETRFDQYNGRGRLVSSEVAELVLRLDESGEVVTEVVYASSNGDDVTDDRQDGDGGGGNPFGGGGDDDEDSNMFSGLQLSPFDPEQQERVTVTPIAGQSTINGVRVQLFEFVHETDSRSDNTGRAWIDVETGEPVLLEVTLSPLPRLLSEFTMRQEFGRDENDRLVMNRMEFHGEGTLLLIRRRIESELVFSDYFPSP